MRHHPIRTHPLGAILRRRQTSIGLSPMRHHPHCPPSTPSTETRLPQTLTLRLPSTARPSRPDLTRLARTGRSRPQFARIRAMSTIGRGHSSLTRPWRVPPYLLPLPPGTRMRLRTQILAMELTAASRPERQAGLQKGTRSSRGTRRSPRSRPCRRARPRSSRSIRQCTRLRHTPSSSTSSKPNHSTIRVLRTRNRHRRRPSHRCPVIRTPGPWSDRSHPTPAAFWTSTVSLGSSSSSKTCPSGPKVRLHIFGFHMGPSLLISNSIHRRNVSES